MYYNAGGTDIQAFIHRFRLRYGRLHPAFYNGTFKQATVQWLHSVIVSRPIDCFPYTLII